jgi:hypothetical protein
MKIKGTRGSYKEAKSIQHKKRQIAERKSFTYTAMTGSGPSVTVSTTGNRCQHCGKHKATVNWVGQGGILEYAHGMYEMWCECCALKVQIKHMKKEIKSLARLEKKLGKIKCK